MKPLIPLFTILLLLAGCRGTHVAPTDPCSGPVNAVYFWKTTFNPDSSDLAFLRRHDVGRIYIRMFDVAPSNYPGYNTEPIASLRVDSAACALIADSLSAIEFTPVVYITDDAIRNIGDQVEFTAQNIVTRVKNMCSYNELPNVHELQLDCDWTNTTQPTFFALCRAVRSQIKSQGLDWRLSSTIRLHQLKGTPPPVDSGVLMVYNTGAFNNPATKNSILHPEDVQPYVKYLSTYELPLDVAYPTYNWQLLFRHDNFIGLTNGIDVADTTRFFPKKGNVYEVRDAFSHNGRMLFTGDCVRFEESAPATILKVKDMIEDNIPNPSHSTIIYHLDCRNLSKFSPDEIDSIYASAAR